jgi:hypothetical protein
MVNGALTRASGGRADPGHARQSQFVLRRAG